MVSHSDWPVIVAIFDGHLALRVGAEIADQSLPAAIGQSPGDVVRERDGQWHELRCFINRVADHHALIAGAGLLVGVFATANFQCRSNARGRCPWNCSSMATRTLQESPSNP